MDTHKKNSFLTYTPQMLPPTQLLIGPHDQGLQEVELFLQKLLCTNNACNTCTSCMQIREKQHHALMWIHPEKNYTIDQLPNFVMCCVAISLTMFLQHSHSNYNQTNFFSLLFKKQTSLLLHALINY